MLIRLEDIFEKETKYPAYYVLNFPGTYIDSELNVILVDTVIKRTIGTPRKMTKLNRSSILVHVVSEQQGETLMEINKIAGNPVTVQLHRTLSIVKGTVYSEAMSNGTEEEILEKLADQGVTKVERTKRRINS